MKIVEATLKSVEVNSSKVLCLLLALSQLTTTVLDSVSVYLYHKHILALSYWQFGATYKTALYIYFALWLQTDSMNAIVLLVQHSWS